MYLSTWISLKSVSALRSFIYVNKQWTKKEITREERRKRERKQGRGVKRKELEVEEENGIKWRKEVGGKEKKGVYRHEGKTVLNTEVHQIKMMLGNHIIYIIYAEMKRRSEKRPPEHLQEKKRPRGGAAVLENLPPPARVMTAPVTTPGHPDHEGGVLTRVPTTLLLPACVSPAGSAERGRAWPHPTFFGTWSSRQLDNSVTAGD